MKIKLPELKCRRCGKEWTPRTSEVRECPKRKSSKWDLPKDEKKRGMKLGPKEITEDFPENY